jgi:signal peptidase I
VDSRWWLQMRKTIQNGELVVPNGSYFVLGDNRDESLDSRYWGFVPRQNVIGTPLVIYWSLRSSGPEPDGADGKLARLAYIVSHLYQDTRWSRTFRLIR